MFIRGGEVMEITTGLGLGLSLGSVVITILNIALWGVGIYGLYLLIKALRIYIKKNS